MALASDGSAALRWDAVLFWAGAVVTLLLAARGTKDRVASFDPRAWRGLAMVLAVAATLRLLFLDSYPIVLVGDAVRDSGLHPQRVLASSEVNPFGLGPYHVFHNVLSLYTGLFQRFAPGPTGLQLASLTLAVGEAALLYRLAWRWIGLWGALLAGLVLATSPLHLAFARNDPSLMLGSFWTVLLLERGEAWLRRRGTPDGDRSLLVLGIVAGLGANLHWTARVVGAWLMLLIGLDFARAAYRGTTTRAAAVRSMALLLGAALVGYGPSFLFADLFLTDSREYDLLTLFHRYGRSLLGYVGVPLNGYVFSGRPFLLPLLVLPFLVGLALCFARRAPVSARALGLLLLLVPFTNSAGASILLADSFLLPLVPLAALAIAYGVVELFRRGGASVRYGRVAAGLVVVSAVGGAAGFFLAEPLLLPPGSGMTPPMLFAYGNALRAVRSDPKLSRSEKVCLGVSAGLERALTLAHWRENLDFYLSGRRAELQVVPEASDGMVYLSTACPVDRAAIAWKTTSPCEKRQAFVCPREPAAITLYVAP